MAYQVAVVIFLSVGTISDLKIEFILKKKEMSQSNNHLSMINFLLFLFFLGISPAKGSTCRTQCCSVVKIWKALGKTTTVNPNQAKGCCTKLGTTFTRTSDIPRVHCNTDGEVLRIDWSDRGLKGNISADIGDLVDLQSL
jgi:hypothetical protein